MPIIDHIKLSADAEIGIWKITEERQDLFHGLELSQTEQAELAAIRSERSSREWLACRQLIKTLLADNLCVIIKDAFGKPFLEGSSKHISISHTHGFAAVIISSFPSGIDIQKIDKRIEAIAFKFINNEEWQSIPQEADRLAAIHLVWGGKEALYKLYGRKSLAFKENLHIYPFILSGSGAIHGHIAKGKYMEKFELSYRQTTDYMLVYVDGRII